MIKYKGNIHCINSYFILFQIYRCVYSLMIVGTCFSVSFPRRKLGNRIPSSKNDKSMYNFLFLFLFYFIFIFYFILLFFIYYYYIFFCNSK